MKTLRERFTSGLYAEAGAMRIPTTHKLTDWLVKNVLGLGPSRLWKFINESDNAHFFINKVHKTVKEAREENCTFGLLKPGIKPDKAPDKMLIGAIERLMVKEEKIKTPFSQLNPESSEFRQMRIRLDHYSLATFLSDADLWHPIVPEEQWYPNYIASVLNLEALLPVSMAAIFDALYIFGQEEFYQIPDGMDRLPKAFVDDSGDGKVKPNLWSSLRYNRRVTEIIEDVERDKPIFVRYENPATSHGNDYEKAIDEKWFDLVVIAIPFSALRRVLMTNTESSSEKQRAIRQLHYQNSCKVILEFSDIPTADILWFRKGRGEIVGGKSYTDLPIRQIVYPSRDQMERGRNRAVLLASYTLGTDSLRWTSLPPRDRLRFALRDVAQVHKIVEPRKIEEFNKACIGGMSHSWVEDEFTAGAFAMFAPSQLSGLFASVWTSEGRIHYCGEHTSLKHGWIEGAVESGIRAACEVCERISPDGTILEAEPRTRNIQYI